MWLSSYLLMNTLCNGSVTGGTVDVIVSQCNSGQFDCAPNSTDSQCISNSWICDGDRDCKNGADEAMCGMYTMTLCVYVCVSILL